jgi:hypothetical protein
VNKYEKKNINTGKSKSKEEIVKETYHDKNPGVVCNAIAELIFDSICEGVINSFQTLLNLVMNVALVHERKICSQKPHGLMIFPSMISILRNRISSD